MKSVGNLTEFVREHMLEPFNAAQATRDIVAHFDQLASAHEAVLRAHAQLDALTPLLKDCDAHDAVAAGIATLTAQRAALRYYFADHKARLLDGLLAELDSERTGLAAQRKELDDRLADLRAHEASLTVERAGHGGNRLTEIERQIEEIGRARDARRVRFQSFSELLRQAALDPVETAEHFAVRRQQIDAAGSAVDSEIADAQNKLTDARVDKQRLDVQAAEVNAELLVPDGHYRAVSDWIDGQHLRDRVVYYRVPAPATRIAPPEFGRATLAAKLEVKDTEFAPWLERELANRADAECVETMAEFRRAARAVTKAGQIKGGVRHEKDDRFRIDDGSRYVLGWSNERKINTLLDRAEDLAGQLAEAERIQTGLDAVAKAAVARGQVLAGLAQTRDFAEIDYQSAVNRIAVLAQEHARLKAASAELALLDTALAEVKRQIGAAAVVCAVAAFAAVVSYSHIYGLGRVHGQDGTAARLLPLSVDGLILAAAGW